MNCKVQSAPAYPYLFWILEGLLTAS